MAASFRFRTQALDNKKSDCIEDYFWLSHHDFDPDAENQEGRPSIGAGWHASDTAPDEINHTRDTISSEEHAMPEQLNIPTDSGSVISMNCPSFCPHAEVNRKQTSKPQKIWILNSIHTIPSFEVNRCKCSCNQPQTSTGPILKPEPAITIVGEGTKSTVPQGRFPIQAGNDQVRSNFQSTAESVEHSLVKVSPTRRTGSKRSPPSRRGSNVGLDRSETKRFKSTRAKRTSNNTVDTPCGTAAATTPAPKANTPALHIVGTSTSIANQFKPESTSPTSNTDEGIPIDVATATVGISSSQCAAIAPDTANNNDIHNFRNPGHSNANRIQQASVVSSGESSITQRIEGCVRGITTSSPGNGNSTLVNERPGTKNTNATSSNQGTSQDSLGNNKSAGKDPNRREVGILRDSAPNTVGRKSRKPTAKPVPNQQRPSQKDLQSDIGGTQGCTKRRSNKFDCPYCRKTNRDNHMLKEHIRRHDKGKLPSFMCTEPGCDQRFSRARDIPRHLKEMHSDDRPYTCNDKNCGRAFSRREYLKEHRKKDHDITY